MEHGVGGNDAGDIVVYLKGGTTIKNMTSELNSVFLRTVNHVRGEQELTDIELSWAHVSTHGTPPRRVDHHITTPGI
jgi:hypothetical protein